jgi:uncharacterized protein (TIGR02284 family)
MLHEIGDTTMGNRKFIEDLKSLVQLDFDAVQAYDQATSHITEDHVRHTLVSFRSDHERHITELSQIITEFGEVPPKLSRDIKGFILEGLTSLQSLMGTKAALIAMKTNENIVNRRYRKALDSLSMPTAVRNAVLKNYEDEKRHLAYIERAIATELWKYPDLDQLQPVPPPKLGVGIPLSSLNERSKRPPDARL